MRYEAHLTLGLKCSKISRQILTLCMLNRFGRKLCARVADQPPRPSDIPTQSRIDVPPTCVFPTSAIIYPECP
jgi:hypothetical protein